MVTYSDLQSGLEELSLKLRKSVKLDHLFALTDHNALLQHAKFSVPFRREGYTVDDNARALVFAVKARALWPTKKLLQLQRKLLAFLLLMQAEDGRFHNSMDFSQMAKVMILPTVVLIQRLYYKTKFSTHTIASLAITLSGVLMSSISFGNLRPTKIGLIYATLSIVFGSLYQIVHLFYYSLYIIIDFMICAHTSG